MPIVERIDPAIDSRLAIFAALDKSENLGKVKAASAPIITITNTNSIKVKPELFSISDFVNCKLQPKEKGHQYLL
jgi:hypothetical protein